VSSSNRYLRVADFLGGVVRAHTEALLALEAVSARKHYLASDKAVDSCSGFGQASRPHRRPGLLEYSEDDLVSSNIVASLASCVIDCKMTIANVNLIGVLGWYDNETGGSTRLLDLTASIGSTGG
jgi:glyceraldehyde-3-phosphate dehydrogenase/erythrose-4-phosphate dehydrogenase